MWIGRNPLRDLNDLPDEPRLGARLIAIGAFVEIVRWSWPHLSFASYHKADTGFVAYTGWLLTRNHSPLSLGEALLIGGAMAIACGAFIFFRKGWWWWAEHRGEKDITQIDLK